MSDESEKKKIFEGLADASQRAADEHVEGCEYREIFRSLSEAARDLANEQSGPAQVATPAYRHNWENVFGQKMPIGEA